MAGRISCPDNEARQGRNREGEERRRRGGGKVVSLVRRTTQHPFWPGWSPVNLLFMPLSAQISSNDVLGPSSSPFSLLFFSFPSSFFLSSSFSSPFSSFYLLPRGARNGPPRTGLSREEGREEKAKVHRCEGEREERQTRSTRRVSQSNITVPRTTSKIAACLSSSLTPLSSFFSILALSTRWSRVEPRLSRFYVCFT